MAALRLNIPSVFVSGWTNRAGKVSLHGKVHAVDLVDAMVAAADSKFSDEAVGEIERSACPIVGYSALRSFKEHGFGRRAHLVTTSGSRQIWVILLCVPKTSSELMRCWNRLSWRNDRAAMFRSGRPGLAIQVEVAASG
jgi:hypothetical protein